MNIKIIDYKAGNAPSVLNALTKLGYGDRSEVIETPDKLVGATHIILPGVGSADETMRTLTEAGFIPVLNKMVVAQKTPFLGICVGMQILFEHSEEGDVDCLGWLKGKVVRFKSGLRVPQMGWNEVKFYDGFRGFGHDQDGSSGYFYFVNSYHALVPGNIGIWGETDYGGDFMSAVKVANISGTQFHIEKSGPAGLRLLDKFIKEGAI